MAANRRGMLSKVGLGCISLLTAAVVLGSLGVATAAGSGSGTAPVVVMNPTSSPVPVSGTVNVANLPGSQTISGSVSVSNFPTTQTVSVTSPQRQAGNFFFQTVNGSAGSQTVPAGIVVTDMVFSRTSGGAATCEVQPTFGPSGSYLGRFSVAPSEVKTINLGTGIESTTADRVRFNVVTSDPAGCHMYVAWTGFSV